MEIYKHRRDGDILILTVEDFDNWNHVIRNLPFNRFKHIFTPKDLTEDQVNDLKFTICIGDKYFGNICKYEEIIPDTTDIDFAKKEFDKIINENS